MGKYTPMDRHLAPPPPTIASMGTRSMVTRGAFVWETEHGVSRSQPVIVSVSGIHKGVQ